ncbi:MAG: phosphoadenylyl-sulfate reductase [Hyphomicrobiaceae bacterium]
MSAHLGRGADGYREPVTRAAALRELYGSLAAIDLLAAVIEREFPGRIALVSSFGAESAVLLHLVSQIDRHLPVLFLETGQHFSETLRYRDTLVERLRLTDVRPIHPAKADIAREDPEGYLHLADPDRCCALRKVLPLADALTPFTAWISGRKRFQATTRQRLPTIEADATHVKINPIAHWRPEDLTAYMTTHALPVHALVAAGYPSIGCAPCTARVEAGEGDRAGRWRGRQKTECGIHAPEPTGTPMPDLALA